MKTTIAAAVALVTAAAPAYAEVYTYGCRAQDDFKLYTARLDTFKKTITWRGSVFTNLKTITNTGDCAKACFEATNRNGVARLDTATQGVASLTVTSGGPGTDGVEEVECDIIRNR
jgi:hypothetical protein